MDHISHLSMCAAGEHVFFVDGDRIGCLDLRDGRRAALVRDLIGRHESRQSNAELVAAQLVDQSGNRRFVVRAVASEHVRALSRARRLGALGLRYPAVDLGVALLREVEHRLVLRELLAVATLLRALLLRDQAREVRGFRGVREQRVVVDGDHSKLRVGTSVGRLLVDEGHHLGVVGVRDYCEELAAQCDALVALRHALVDALQGRAHAVLRQGTR